MEVKGNVNSCVCLGRG